MIKIDNYKHSQITQNIIYVFNKVHSIYGYGFPKKSYVDALFAEFSKMDLLIKNYVKVFHEDDFPDVFLADFMIEKAILIEIKTLKTLPVETEFEIAKHLNVSEIKIALLLNFGKKPEFNCKIFTTNTVFALP